MASIVPGLIAFALFAVTTANVGVAVAGAFKPLRQSPVFPAFAIAAGMAVGAIAGLVLFLLPPLGPLSGWALLLILNLLALSSHIRMKTSPRWAAHHGAPVVVWVAFSLAILAISLVPPREPVWLKDGPYPFKEWTLPVRVQALTGDMPADNALPAYVGEMMARKISFKEVRPVMPGQELANRPFLLPLIYLPYRLALGGPAPVVEQVPTIEYVGTTWPNVGELISDDTYFVFLAVGIAANAAVVLAFACLLRLLGLRGSSVLAVIVLAAAPYEILHTVFTWPKNLAAFFVTTALCAAVERRSPIIILTLGALAYWSHPYALTFLGGLGLYLGIQWAIDCVRNRRLAIQDFAPIAIGGTIALAAVGSWILWTTYGLNMTGDLVEQNQGQGATMADAINVRMRNLASLIDLHGASPASFGDSTFNRGILTSLVSALGIVSVVLLPFAIMFSRKVSRLLIVLAVLIPGFLVSTVFGVINPPLNHGWQAAVPMLAALVLAFGDRFAGRWGVWALALLSLASSTLLLASIAQQWRQQDDRQSIMLRDYTTFPGSQTPGVGVTVDITGVVRQSVFTSADSQITFDDIQVRSGDVLRMYVSVHPETYQAQGDVTVFRVEAVPKEGPPVTVYLRALDPRSKPLDQGWKLVHAPLGLAVGGPIRLRFTCASGPAGNTAGDWCIWGEPIVTRAVSEIATGD